MHVLPSFLTEGTEGAEGDTGTDGDAPANVNGDHDLQNCQKTQVYHDDQDTPTNVGQVTPDSEVHNDIADDVSESESDSYSETESEFGFRVYPNSDSDSEDSGSVIDSDVENDEDYFLANNIIQLASEGNEEGLVKVLTENTLLPIQVKMIAIGLHKSGSVGQMTSRVFGILGRYAPVVGLRLTGYPRSFQPEKCPRGGLENGGGL